MMTQKNFLAALTALLVGLSQPVYSNTDTHGHDDAADYSDDDSGSHSHAEEGDCDEFHDHDQPDDHEESDADAHAGEEHDEHDHEEGVVALSPDVLEEFGIELAQAGPGTLHEEVVLPGEIQFNREHVAYVTPRYAGTVMEINVRLADAVKKDQVLATLESTDTLRPFEVKAPFDGVITAYEVTQGETVEAGTPLFTVADLSTVWADLRIYQRDLGKIARDQPVVIFGGHDGGVIRGKISYIAPVIDEHTRTGLARVVVENPDGAWRPGQFIKGRVMVDEHEEAVLVPRTALLEYEGETVVFVQTGEGFEPRPVVLGHGDAGSLAVESGLEPGETYVTRNALSLKAELGKGSFGGHHH